MANIATALSSERMPNRVPVLIVFSGLPGAGKTTLAKCMTQLIRAIYLRIDTIEQALAQSSQRIPSDSDAGYEAAYKVARENLSLGNDVVADCVNPILLSRQAWEVIAHDTGAELIQVEVVCRDMVEHRRRIGSRSSDIKGHRLPTWDDVRKSDYEPWTTDRIVIDTAHESVNRSFSKLLTSIEEKFERVSFGDS